MTQGTLFDAPSHRPRSGRATGKRKYEKPPAWAVAELEGFGVPAYIGRKMPIGRFWACLFAAREKAKANSPEGRKATIAGIAARLRAGIAPGVEGFDREAVYAACVEAVAVADEAALRRIAGGLAAFLESLAA